MTQLDNTIPWVEFLANSPPDELFVVTEAIIKAWDAGYRLEVPGLLLFCDDERCQRHQQFICTSGSPNGQYGVQDFHLLYTCRNCGQSRKRFAVLLDVEDYSNSNEVEAVKLGEFPPFGPHIPTDLESLLSEDIDLFEKGLRAESRGLGIGAFAYYRRVVEGRKDALFDQIIEIGQMNNLPAEKLARLKKLKDEWRFSKAIAGLKADDLIPESLLIEGENPLMLLHRAFSDGLHNLPDSECLRRAIALRTVLEAMAESIARILHKDSQLKAAVKAIREDFQTPELLVSEANSNSSALTESSDAGTKA